jgi:hypothetical protein
MVLVEFDVHGTPLALGILNLDLTVGLYLNILVALAAKLRKNGFDLFHLCGGQFVIVIVNREGWADEEQARNKSESHDFVHINLLVSARGRPKGERQQA